MRNSSNNFDFLNLNTSFELLIPYILFCTSVNFSKFPFFKKSSNDIGAHLNMTVPSSEPVINIFPSGEKATDVTAFICPLNTFSKFPFLSHKRAPVLFFTRRVIGGPGEAFPWTSESRRRQFDVAVSLIFGTTLYFLLELIKIPMCF